MKVSVTNSFILEPHVEKFKIKYAWTRKKGVNKNWWFTPSGTLKIWWVGLNTEVIGRVTPQVYKELLSQLVSNKAEMFYCLSENKYITLVGNNKLTMMDNINNILFNAKKEAELRFEFN